MIRRHVTALRLLFMAVDGLDALPACSPSSRSLRFGSDDWLASWTAAGVDGRVLAVAYGIAWVCATWLLGLYRLRVRWSIRTELVDLVRADLLVAVATFAILFLFKLPNVSRLFLVELFVAQVALSAFVRIGAPARLRLGTRARPEHPLGPVVGAGPAAEAFADRLEQHRELGLAGRSAT